MTLNAVDAVPTCSEPPAVVVVHISLVERHGFGASASSSIGAPPLYWESWRLGGIITEAGQMNQVVIDPGRRYITPCFARFAAAFSVRVRVFISGSASASVARCGY